MSKDNVASAYQKYLQSLGYDEGVMARKRGGYMGFGKAFKKGGFEDSIYGSDDDDGFGLTGEFIDGMKAKLSGASSWYGEHAKEVNAVGTGIFSAVEQAGLTKTFDDYQRELAASNPSATGVLDNDAILNWYSENPYVSDTTARDFRDKSVWDDLKSAGAAGLSAGATTSNPLIAGAVAAANLLGSGIGRLRAKNASSRANEANAVMNKRIDTALFHAGQQADANNDILRMVGFYNQPYDYALGGEMRSHGSDWNNGLTFIDAGGTHEQNPFEGVPSGVDDEGVPNLVEEGEVIWNNEYVFSNRIKIPADLRKKYKLKEGMTFAEGITEVTKESQSRPNDPISNETNRAIVNEFMEEQEMLREKEQQRAAAQLQSAIDEDFMNQLEAYSQPEIQGAPMELGAPQGMPQEGMPLEGQPVGFAFGGHKFAGGGPEEDWENYFDIETDSSGNTIYIAPDGVKYYTPEDAFASLSARSEPAPSRELVSSALVPATTVVASRPVEPQPAETKPAATRDTNKIYKSSAGYDTKGKPMYRYTVYDEKGRPKVYSTYEEAVKEYSSTIRKANVKGGYAYVDINGKPHANAKDARKASLDTINRESAPADSVKTASSSKPGTSAQSQRQAASSNTVRTTAGTQPQRQSSNVQSQAYSTTGTSSRQASTSTGSNAATGSRTAARPASGSTAGGPSTVRSSSGRQIESSRYYSELVTSMENASPETRAKLVEDINNNLPSGVRKVKDYNDWKNRATDGINGPVHRATETVANRYAALNFRLPNVELTPFDYNFEVPSENITTDPVEVPVLSDASQPQEGGMYNGLRQAPIWGSGIMALNSLLEGPDYANANAIIDAARAAGTPVNIPVQTIGDYRTRKPYDERYLVNMANQNRVAAARGIANTSAGNRAMDLLGNMSLAYNSQQNLGEIMRQAYLANRQDDATVAEFNRGTNLQNMQAINQRNLSQAQLNSQRQAAALNGLARGYGMREEVWRDWRNDRDSNISAFLDNLGLYGREGVTDNQALSFLKELGTNWTFDRNSGVISFMPKARGGRKRRRF